MSESMDWVDKQEEVNKENRSKGYFNIEEGSQQFVLLSHCEPLAQVFDPSTKKYRAAQEGDTNVSIKGLCWVLQDGLIKEAKLPYTLVKTIRGIQQNPEWEFAIPFLHTFTLIAQGAGTKEVKYTLTPSPKKVELPAEVVAELKKKPKPSEIVEKIKGRAGGSTSKEAGYPTAEEEGINTDDIPFD